MFRIEKGCSIMVFLSGLNRQIDFRSLFRKGGHGGNRFVEGSDQFLSRGRLDSRNTRFRVVLETGRPGDHRSQDYRHQDVGNLRRHLFHHEHEGERPDPEHEGRPVGVIGRRLADLDYGFIVMRRTIHVNAEHFLQLGSGDDDGGGVGETVDDRMRKKVDHQTETKHTEQKLKGSYQEGKHHSIGDVPLAAGCGKRGKRRRGHQGNDRHRSGGQLAAGAKERRNHRRQEGRIQTVIRGQSGQLGIGHGLRDENQGHGQSGDEIRPKTGRIVPLQPTEKRENFCQHSLHLWFIFNYFAACHQQFAVQRSRII